MTPEQEELMNRNLPKWPQMIVTGKKLTKEQALEIIRRTDTFITYGYEGNDHDFIKQAKQALDMPEDKHYWHDDFKNPDGSHNDDAYIKFNKKRRKKTLDWQEKWGCIYTEYVANSWISCNFINGCHGWCHPDGTIEFSDNIGKWPSTDEVYDDWCLLAKEFPFIDVGITLMSGEKCEETIPIISFRVKNGTVDIVDPDTENVHKEHKKPKDTELNEEQIYERLTNFSFENAIPLEILKEWHDQIFGKK